MKTNFIVIVLRIIYNFVVERVICVSCGIQN
jgi:hypothetical protein